MDESWEANVEIEPTLDGKFVAVLVLTPPSEIGQPIRTEVLGKHDTPLEAETAALDALAAMTRTP